jgi:hypothetical protein
MTVNNESNSTGSIKNLNEDFKNKDLLIIDIKNESAKKLPQIAQ